MEDSQAVVTAISRVIIQNNINMPIYLIALMKTANILCRCFQEVGKEAVTQGSHPGGVKGRYQETLILVNPPQIGG